MVVRNIESSSKRESSTDLPSRNNLINYVLPLYTIGEDPVYLTDQIIVKPKPGITIAAITAFLGDAVRVIKSTKYNSHLLAVKQPSQIFQLLRKLEAQNLTKWCEPNFTSAFKLGMYFK